MKLFFAFLFFSVALVAHSQPKITSFTPASGPIGTVVTITGTGFNTTAANNIVYFGAVKAVVNTATATSLNITVPAGSTYKPISITNSGLTGYSAQPFKVTFTGGAGDFNAGSFSPYSYINSSQNSNGGKGNVLADFDGDGKVDIAIIRNVINGVSIFRNTSAGNQISFSNNADYITGFGSRKMSVSDFNGDGKIDIAVIDNNATSVSILINNSTAGTIAFASKVDFPVGSQPEGIASADIDGDGKPEILTANFTANSISILRNTSTLVTTTFAAKVDFTVGSLPYSIAAGDLNADGKADLAVANVSSGSVSVFRNTSTVGTIAFAAKVDYTDAPGTRHVVIGDIDSDAKPDIVTSNNSTGGVAIFRNTSTTTTAISLAAKFDYPAINYAAELAIEDMDGDGKSDIGVASFNGTSMALIRNTSISGSLSFSPGIPYAFCANDPLPNGQCGNAASIVMGDLDNDGRPDWASSLDLNFSSTRRNQVTLPFIANFSPTQATTGNTVTITGSFFTGATAVKFGNTNAASFTVNSASSITATIAAGSSGKVTVTRPNGTATSVNDFTYYALPTITSFSPTSAAGGTDVYITGTNFSLISAVKFGGVNATLISVESPTLLRARPGAGASGDITVTNIAGTATISGFTFIPAPTISSFTPTSGIIGTTVQITGTNFTGTTMVRFGNTVATSFSIISNTRIDAVVPNILSGTAISVSGPGGTGSSAAGFTFIPPPVVTNFTPSSGKTGTSVTITGSSFNGVTAVSFGGVSASSFNVITSNTITAVVANGASGNISVVANGGTATNGPFTYYAAPTISAFTPTSAGPTLSVTITGNNFIGATAVSFGGTPATSFTVQNATTIVAVVGAGTTGVVSVTTPGGVANAAGFTFVPTPTITSFTPTTSGPGLNVTITGTNFIGVSSVYFGYVIASSFVVNSPTSITATVGEGGISGNVTVNAAGGSASLFGFTFVNRPLINSFTPTTAGAGTTVTINGNYFTGATAVSFGGIPAASFTFVSATQMTAVVAAGSASGNVAVTTTGGTGTLSGFTIIAPPTISSFTPTNAITGTTVTITGTNFTGAYQVRFGGANASSFTVVSATQITAVVPAGLSGSISVTTLGGTATLAGFEYTGITSFTPSSATNGATVTITGSNFTGSTAVRFGGVLSTSFSVVSPTSITAVVGNGATGSITVTTPFGTVTRAGFTYTPPVPTITSFTPTSAANRSTVIITGNHFTGASAVRFGGINAYRFTVVNNTTISAEVAHGASGSVTVTTLGGTATLAGFTYLPTAPTITAFSPIGACATGTTLTIRGLNFTGTNSVQLGGVATTFTLQSDTVITVVTGAVNNSGVITVTTPNGSATSATNFVMGSGVPAFTTNPATFQLCGGAPRLLYTNLTGNYTYVSSNGQSGNAITINAPGNYTLTATDEYGCVGNTAFTVTNYASCGGYLEMESEPIFNYFDTLTVRVRIRNGVDIFSVFSYLNFNPAHLKFVSAVAGDYLGTNVFNQPPVIVGGQIDFGMSHLTGDPGTNGDGLIYTFKFVLADQIPNLAAFNAVKPESFITNLSFTNIRVYNVSGLIPPSFDAISMKTKPVACRYYVPVWPGDLNFDRRVTVADILPIGYFYGGTGPARPDGSLFWKAQPSALWGFDKTNKNSSAYRTFADGDPNGIINLADQASIGFNLSRIRIRKDLNTLYIPPTLGFDPNLPALNVNLPSTQIPLASLPVNETVSISLGSVAMPLNNVYGVAFDIYFDPAFVNTASITTNYLNSIFGTDGVNFTKIEDRSGLSSGRFSIGITRFNTTGINATGGDVLKITLPLKTGSPGGLFKVTVLPQGCNSPTGVELSITGSEDSLIVGSLQACTTNTWVGNISTAWENAANWSCGTVPISTSVVSIPSGRPFAPVIKSMATCKSLTSATGSIIKIDPGYKLTIVGPQ